MSSRRTFLRQAAAAGIVGTASLASAPRALGSAVRKAAPRVKAAIRRDETILRLGGWGDNYHMSWAADDRQLVAMCDGLGWYEKPKQVDNSRLWAIAGEPHNATFHEVSGYPALGSFAKTEQQQRYYGFGTLAVEGRIYQFLSTPNHQFVRPDGTTWPQARFVGAKLIYSPDNGRTWCNQNGSTPVVWERWPERSRENMVFFEESQEAFSLLSILQMGRNYRANRDGYVYVYASNGNVEGTMNQLVLFRVPKARVLERSAYEYFAGLTGDGKARWTQNINARGIVHTFPKGWVNKTLHPWAWMPSVAYNLPLGLYMMASWGTALTNDGQWFARPSYLGLWVASNPWGPWTQVLEETAWMPNQDAAARAFAPQIAPKWIAPDGRSFWLVWSDFQITDQHQAQRLDIEFERADTLDEQMKVLEQYRRVQPYYAFNTQRVDLVVA